MSVARQGGSQTRRTALVAGGAILALGATGAWLIGTKGPDSLAALQTRADAPTLRVLGHAYLTSTPLPKNDVEARLRSRLTGDLPDAIAADHAAGRLISVDGWLISETQALAGAWIALNKS